jgi:hypothetical protein
MTMNLDDEVPAMEHAIAGTVNPWVSIWTRPRETVRYLLETDPERMVLVLAALGGISQLLDQASTRNAGDTFPVTTAVLLAVLLGPAIGLFSLFLGSILVAWTGRWMGGGGSARQLRTALAWANVPLVASLLLWIPLMLGVGEEMFTSYTPRLESSPVLALMVLLLGMVGIVLAIWSLVILLKGVGEVQGFSAWKALGNVLLAFLVVLVPIVLMAVVAAIILPAA